MSARRAVFAAAAAATAGALLLGGNATYAAWSDSAKSEKTTITAGTLAAEITQSDPASVAMGEGASAGIFPGDNSKGIIPGAQGQRWTYTVTNSSKSAVTANVALKINGSVSNVTDYAAIRPYLKATTKVGATTTEIPSSAFTASGFQHTVKLGDKLAPGKKATIELTLSMPATVTNSQGQKVDVAVELIKHRSATTDAQKIFTMENSASLSQVGQP